MIPLIVAAIGGMGSYLFIDKMLKPTAAPGTPPPQPGQPQQPAFQPQPQAQQQPAFQPQQPAFQPQAPAAPKPDPFANFNPNPAPTPAPSPQQPAAALPVRARITTNDPAPSGDVYLRTSPTAAGIPGVGAEKNGIVTVLSNEGLWCRVSWPGGTRLGPATGYVKTQYLTFI